MEIKYLRNYQGARIRIGAEQVRRINMRIPVSSFLFERIARYINNPLVAQESAVNKLASVPLMEHAQVRKHIQNPRDELAISEIFEKGLKARLKSNIASFPDKYPANWNYLNSDFLQMSPKKAAGILDEIAITERMINTTDDPGIKSQAFPKQPDFMNPWHNYAVIFYDELFMEIFNDNDEEINSKVQILEKTQSNEAFWKAVMSICRADRSYPPSWLQNMDKFFDRISSAKIANILDLTYINSEYWPNSNWKTGDGRTNMIYSDPRSVIRDFMLRVPSLEQFSIVMDNMDKGIVDEMGKGLRARCNSVAFPGVIRGIDDYETRCAKWFFLDK